VTTSAKIMLLGDIGVGKSSLANRLVFDRFESEYKTTIGVDVLTHDVDCGGQLLRMILWDTDGDFGQRIFETVYSRGASGAIIVSDASRPSTTLKMANLARGFEEHFPGRPLRSVINKIDLAPGERAAIAGGLRPDETLYSSALTGEGVSELFASIGSAIIRRGL
jgi:Ras-related protein Rab-5C